ncbi:hypothetical protein CUMW_266280 [Citrus unshiu]|uniref:40S ribosomal protein S27 n=1 Tax=Citrus unshiu TaxID=55188 RepID=A0A2H5QVR0_CITUN|nr:hypothetical protein CUMW_266280 [Citrus unshiu]
MKKEASVLFTLKDKMYVEGFPSGSPVAFANMDAKCQGCFNITTIFSHSQTVVVCGNCQSVLRQPTGGRARLTEGCYFRKKANVLHAGFLIFALLNEDTHLYRLRDDHI